MKRFYILYDSRCIDEFDIDKANVLYAIGPKNSAEAARQEAKKSFPNMGAVLWSYAESKDNILKDERCEGPID